MDGPIRLFISHAHRDVDIAQRLVTALDEAMAVPNGAIRCTSLPGYKLDLGAMPPDVLRKELASADCVVAILTPYGLASQWVLFELGATWSQAKQVIPLLGGGIKSEDIPGPFRGAIGGLLTEQSALDQFLEQMIKLFGWPVRNALAARNTLAQLVIHVAGRLFFEDDLQREIKASFAAKRVRIGPAQGSIIDYITYNLNDRSYIPQDELSRKFDKVQTPIYYRLEQLRYLGFLTRQEIGRRGGLPDYGWTLSKKYQEDLA